MISSALVADWLRPYGDQFVRNDATAATPQAQRLTRTAAAAEPVLLEAHEQLNRVAALMDNWDGHGSVSPDPIAATNARELLEKYHEQVELARSIREIMPPWRDPHISPNERGNIVFEWWNDNKKVTIYIGQGDPTYIKSWGPHVLTDMEDGLVPEVGFFALWGWLFG